jgi:hypothetical protein
MEEILKTILQKLAKKTEKGKTIWSKTSGNGFKISFPDSATIMISMVYDAVSEYHYTVEIFNNDGEQVDFYAAYKSNGDDEFALLEELYNSARRAYYKVDETYKSMMNNIDNTDVVGSKIYESITIQCPDATQSQNKNMK